MHDYYVHYVYTKNQKNKNDLTYPLSLSGIFAEVPEVPIAVLGSCYSSYKSNSSCMYRHIYYNIILQLALYSLFCITASCN